MLKYIVIWLCIGYIVALMYFIYYYKFDVNVLLDDIDNYSRKTPFGELTDEEMKEIRSNNVFVQFVVSIIAVAFIIVWPILIRDFVITFKRKLR